MKLKLSTVIFMAIFSVILFSCNKVTKPEVINEIDPKYLKPGQLSKTLGYEFPDNFIFHGWEGQEAIVKEIGNGSKPWVKKIVSSQYFDIYVDTSNYEKAINNIKDTVWHELVKDLKKRHAKLLNIYGVSSRDLSLKNNNRDKVEIIFHKSYEGFKNNVDGYFWGVRNISINPKYLTKVDITNAQLKAIIIHELQHYINYYYIHMGHDEPLRGYNEALSESTVPVIFTNRPNEFYPYRSTDFKNSRNGQYFFRWDSKKREDTSGYYNTASYFMYWLYIHGGGDKIIKDIVSIGKSKGAIDNKTIADAVNRNIPYFKGANYDTIIFNWHKANFYNNPSGLLGYKNQVNITLYLANGPSEKIGLSPQCAVYTTQDMYDKNKNIAGIKLTKLSDSKRKWLLIYNSDSSAKTVYINPRGIPRIPTWNNSNLPVWDENKSWTKNNTSLPTWK